MFACSSFIIDSESETNAYSTSYNHNKVKNIKKNLDFDLYVKDVFWMFLCEFVTNMDGIDFFPNSIDSIKIWVIVADLQDMISDLHAFAIKMFYLGCERNERI